MTKEEIQSLSNQLTNKEKAQAAEKRQRNYDIMLKALKEIAVDYPAHMSQRKNATLCNYLIALAKTALETIKP